MDPQPIPYATPARKGTPAAGVLTAVTAGWRTAAGAAWLAGILALAVSFVFRLYDEQQWIGSTPISFSVVARIRAIEWVCLGAGPAGFALGIGATLAVVLYHWTLNRLAWAAVLPAVAACGAMPQMVVSGADGSALIGLLEIVAIQCGLVYAGTHLGRPLGRRLARLLVPPPLRASLVAIWI